MSPPVADSHTPGSPADRATLLVADAVGELMGLWNFKPSMGRVWAVLYLSRQPLSADELAERAQLSTGSVSMTVKDLLEWGVIKRDFSPGERRRRFAAETDILGMVTRVFRKRELHWIETLISRLEEARRILDDEGRTSVPDDLLRNRFLATRVDALLTLAKAGRRVVDRFARAGTLDLRGLRGALGRRGRTG
jgi:HTH-type transcriptional regulator, glycine betaine synthesis regulator